MPLYKQGGASGGGAVDSVNSQTGVVVLDQDDIGDGSTNKQYSGTDKTKLAGIASGATANDTDANLKNRANHTGEQAVSTVTGLQDSLDTILPKDGDGNIILSKIGAYNPALVWEESAGLYADYGVDGMGSWYPSLYLDGTTGIAQFDNTSNGDADNRKLFINMTGGLEIYNGSYGARFKADNVTDNRTLQAPDSDGTIALQSDVNTRVKVLAQSAVSVTAGAVTTEETLATITVPASTMGANGRIRITALWTNIGTNNKTRRITWGGTQVYQRADATNNQTNRVEVEIANRNATNSQHAHVLGTMSSGTMTQGQSTPAIDTTVDQNILILAQKAVAGDTMRLESYLVELLPN